MPRPQPLRRPVCLRRARGLDRERGSVTLFLAITAMGLLILAGLVVDGGAKLRATQRADQVAAEAARAAGQAINAPSTIAGATPATDPGAAVAAAQTYLATTGVTGSVSITPGGTAVTVTTSESAPTVFLGLIGIHTLPVTGQASVALVHGITGAGT